MESADGALLAITNDSPTIGAKWPAFTDSMLATTGVWTNVSAGALRDDASVRREWDRLNSSCGDLPFGSADAIGVALDVFGNGRERLETGDDKDLVVAMPPAKP